MAGQSVAFPLKFIAIVLKSLQMGGIAVKTLILWKAT